MKGYINWVRRQPCLGCGRGAQAHHLRTGEDAGVGMKPPDTRCVPLCAECHHLVHQHGQKRWEKVRGIDLEASLAELLREYSSELDRTRRAML